MESSANNDDESRREIYELIALQTGAIKRLEAHFSPESVEEVEERRFQRLRSIAIRGGSICALIISGFVGAWELGIYFKESWEVRQTAENYANVGIKIYYDENNITVAKEFLQKALELSPDNPNYMYLGAYIDGMSEVRLLFNLDRPYTSKELDSAHRAIAKSILLEQQEPDKPEAYILRGQIYAALKEKGRAIASLKKAIDLAPKNDFAIMRLGVVEYTNSNTEKALKLFDRALSLNPESKWAHLWKGIVFSETRKLNEARESLTLALKEDPRFDLALYNLGWVNLKERKKKYGVAEEFFRKALAVNPAYKEAFYGMGMVYGYQNQYEVAHRYFSKALELDSAFLTAWKWRGIVSYEMGKYDNAVSDFSKGLELDPSNADLFVRRARVSILTKKYTESLADLLLATKFDQNNPRTFLYLGQVYLGLRRLDTAMESLTRALELNPRYSDAHALVAKIHMERGHNSKAIGSYQKALQSTKYRQERFAVPMARIMVSESQFTEAYDVLNGLALEGNRSPDLWFELFKTAIALGNVDRAKAVLAEFTRLAPASDQISWMKSKLN